MLRQIQKVVESDLERFNNVFRNSLTGEVAIVNQMMSYLLKTQGKQMRPLFVMLTANMVGKATLQSYVAATVIELVHTASLVHDDVVDEAYQRRGKLSMNAIYRSKGAVLAGDYILAKAMKLAVDNKLYEVIDFVAQVMEQMSQGELMQSDFSVKLNITQEEYFEVIRRKTALLLATCGWAGAKCSGGSDAEANEMFKFGELLGLAFQIKDDILDFTVKSATGKIACNDLKEHKLTLPIIYVLERSNPSERAKILSMVRKADTSPKIVALLRDMVIAKGGIEAAETKMEELKAQAIALLDNFSDSEYRSSLKEFANYILTRNK